jgi:diaminobutyrate-2-oxoglutarate transaminase
MTLTFERYESNVRYYCRHFPATFATARGVWMIDRSGRRYIDFLSGAGSLNYGHNHPAVMTEVMAYLAGGGIVQSLDFYTAAKEEFLDLLARHIFAPRGLEYKVQFTGPTGANAVEAAIKLARKVTGRHMIAAFSNAYHGVSLGALAATANPAKRASAGIPLGQTVFLPYDGYLGGNLDTSMVAERMLAGPGSGIDAPAAVLLEIVQGEGGLNAAGTAWIRSIAEICRGIGALLIVDDIQAGCGRTGRFFSFETCGITPDIVVLSKSLSGFGAPLSVVLMRPELDVWKSGEHNGTFRGNNLAFVGGSAAIRHFWSSDAFSAAVQERAACLLRELESICDQVPDNAASVVGRGMITGIAFTRPEFATAISSRLFEHGMIAETCGASDHVLKLLPPLTIDDDDLRTGLSILRETVAAVCRMEAVGR